MTNLDLVIFDCDGVLVDSEVISNEVLAQALSRAGLATTLAQARREYQGLLLVDIVARAESNLGRALPAGWRERYERERDDGFRVALQPVDGADAAVAAVRGAGIAVCVASQGRLQKTRLTLGLTGLDGLFCASALFSSEQVPRGKPHPDLFLHAASSMGVAPEHCAVIEDSPSGVTAAVAAGMRALGFTADSDEASLRAAGAECFGALSELPALLGLD